MAMGDVFGGITAYGQTSISLTGRVRGKREGGAREGMITELSGESLLVGGGCLDARYDKRAD